MNFREAKQLKDLSRLAEQLARRLEALEGRLQELETRRRPGRPKKHEEKVNGVEA